MPQDDDSLLDLSAWPAPPPARRDEPVAPPARATLPWRPVRRPGRARPSLRAVAVVAALLGTAILLVPTPGCGSSVAAYLRDPRPVPAADEPALDDEQVAADATGVRQAEADLAAWRPAPRSPRAAPVPSSRTRTVTAVDAGEVHAAEAELSAAQRDVAAHQAELDRLLAEQEEADDPGVYDGQVAAAREELDQSVARLDEARRALSASRARTTTEAVTVTRPPSPPARSTTPVVDRVALVQALAEARAVQAAHLAARKGQLADWRSGLQQRTSDVTAHNARVASCGRRSGVPVRGGFLLLVLGGAGLLRDRLTV